MHVEVARTYPVTRHEGFEVVADIRTWGDWTALDILDAEQSVWRHSGDVVRYERKSSLPGFAMNGEIVLDELVPDELLRVTFTGTGLPDMPVACRFADAGPGAFTLTLTVHTKDPVGFVEDALERLEFIESFTARDLERGLDGLERMFSNPVAA